MTQNAANPLSPSELQPGDVLLSRGVGELSDLICDVDGGSYSHAGLWDGRRVVEATLGGVAAVALEQDLTKQLYVDAYRFERDGLRLGHARWRAEPVCAQAQTFLGIPYSYSDLMMAALVIALGRRTSIPAMKLALRRFGAYVGPRAAEALFGMDRSRPAKVCTDVVVSAFHDAQYDPSNGYALEVRVRRLNPAETDEEAAFDPVHEEYLTLTETFRDKLLHELPEIGSEVDAHSEASSMEGIKWRDRIVRAGSRHLPASCVTPYDLESSPSLVCLGRLQKG